MDIEELFRPRLPEADVELPGVGTVRVRGLSRYEVLTAQREESRGTLAIERVMLEFGMVDPPMTGEQVTRWQRASPAGELEPVTRAIRDLSGMGAGADKAAYKSDGDGTGSGIRVLPGAEAIDDGGTPAG